MLAVFVVNSDDSDFVYRTFPAPTQQQIKVLSETTRSVLVN